jgi:hypothetical protein
MDIIQHLGVIYLTKGNDIVPISVRPMMIGNEENPSIAKAKALIADGYEIALDDGSENSKPVRQKIMDFNKGVRSMGIDTTDSLGSKILNTVSKLGGKLPGALGILDILGMKGEYDQIMEGTHPSGITMTEEQFKEKFGNQVYADGGYVTNPFVKDIFED